MRNLATIFPLKSTLSRKFQRFNAIDGRSKSWKIVNWIKMKNCKTFYEAQTASCLEKIIQPPPNLPQIKSSLTSSLEQKVSYRDIQNRHLLSKCFKNAFLGRQEMVQCKCFFLKPKRSFLKICKVTKIFGYVAGAYYLQCQVSWGS